MDINFVLSLCIALVSMAVFISSTTVMVRVNGSQRKEFREELKEFKASVEKRLGVLETDVATIKAICQERSGKIP